MNSPESTKIKIVSLLPSATEIVAALGLEKHLVGRSHECDYPPSVQDLPVCTSARIDSAESSAKIDRQVKDIAQAALSIYQVRLDVLQQLQPTHIITQDQCDVCAVSLADVQQAVNQLVGTQPEIISLQPQQLSQVWQDIRRVAEAFKIDSEPLLQELQLRIDSCKLRKRSGEANRHHDLPSERIPTVAAIEWTEPLMIAGNWIPELVEIAGGKPALSAKNKNSTYTQWSALLEADPDVIVIMPCGFDLERTRVETKALSQHSQWQKLQAVQHGRVYITDGNAYFNRPGPRLVDSIEILAEILHPELYNFAYQHEAWEMFN